MADYDVILASGAEHLGKRFKEIGYKVYSSAPNYDGKRIFPNGDLYVRIPRLSRLSNRRVVIIQSCTGSGPSDQETYTTSDRLVELLLILDLLNKPVEVEETGHKVYCETPIEPPSKIEVVLTFQPFALQDKAFKTGEAVSAKWAMRMIADSCDKIWVLNPHAPDSLEWVRDLSNIEKLETIDITKDLIEFGATQFGFDEYSIITPDEGGQERFDCAGFGKKRTNSFNVEIQGDVKVEGNNVIIIDDLTKSGSTLLKAADRLRKQGAKDIGLAVIHVLPLIDIGEELLENLVSKIEGRIVVSNTIDTHVFSVKNPELTYNIVDRLCKILSGEISN
ncbi:MAG: phosphoribosyltransferase family protein [Candidatus Thorarchaeota archaeon]